MVSLQRLERHAPACQTSVGWESWFGARRCVFVPVAYVSDESSALRDVETALDAGADGVFFVNNGIACRELVQIAVRICCRHRGLFLGIHCVGSSTSCPLEAPPSEIAAVWMQSAHAAQGARESRCAHTISGCGESSSAIVFLEMQPDTLRRKRPGFSLPGLDRGGPVVPTVTIRNGDGLCEMARVRQADDDATLGVSVPAALAEACIPYASCLLTSPRSDRRLGQLDPGLTRHLADAARARC